MMMNILQDYLQLRKRTPNTDAVRFVQGFLENYKQDQQHFIYLPSLRKLAEEMACPEHDIRQALETVTARGFRYLMLHRESPIALWKPLIVD